MTRRGLFRYRDDGGCLEVSWNDILAQTCRLSHQDVEEMEVELSKPINLPNDRLLFESHHWISLRTPGDSHFFWRLKQAIFPGKTGPSPSVIMVTNTSIFGQTMMFF